jgi:integrase
MLLGGIGSGTVLQGSATTTHANHFGLFRIKDRTSASLPANIWARDLRASGISEGRAAGVSMDDAAKVAGHASTRMTSAVYDRAVLAAAERFAEARSNKRKE